MSTTDSQGTVVQRLTAYKLRIRDIKDGRFTESTERFEPSTIETRIGIRAGRVRIMGTVVKKFVSTEGKPFAFITVDDATETIRVKIWQDVAIFDGVEEGDIVDVIGKVRKYEDEIYIAPEVVRKVEDPNEETLRRLEVLEFLRNRAKKKEPEERQETHEEDVGEGVEIVTDEEEETREADEPLVGGERQTETTPEPTGGEKKPAASLAVFAKKGEPSPKPETVPRPEKKEEAPKRDTSLRDVLLSVIKSMDGGSGADTEDVIALVKKQTGETEERIEEAIEALLNEGTCYEPRSGKIKLL